MYLFSHNNSAAFRRGTFAVKPLPKNVLERLTLDNPGILISIGVAFVHHGDKYVKKIGRNVAVEKSKLTMAFLTNITKEAHRTYYHFQFDCVLPRTYDLTPATQLVKFSLSTTERSKNVHMEYCYFDPSN